MIKESLRISPGVASPLLRVVPATGATVTGAYIPPHVSHGFSKNLSLTTNVSQTIIGMSGTFVHSSKAIFKNPETFDPERWLQKDSASLEKWLVAFSKGPRMCMGQK